ncbi:beta carbonic anhydrase 1 isoform X2 [Penaeus vannamei]|uniref:beta carbonic anhydrase 1 isoform X2 n=1 Tax=Penaeus vannamei TaxID=6689 RepID=UPI000F68F450|nr:beta carbonic anhydrase 1-like [Penaeus vannamei]
MGMSRILQGIMRYRETYRAGMVKQFEIVRDDPHPKAVFFSCMDSRMLPTRFTQTNVGDMFIVRNAGNLVPHANLCGHEEITTEPAALELGCVINGIRHVIVCGHSDCKAMNMLHLLRNTDRLHHEIIRLSPLKAWLVRHGSSSLAKFAQLEVANFQAPLIFQAETPMRRFVAYIDPDNKFSDEDKLSQVNTLQQLQNIASYNFMREGLSRGKVYIHALWFDIYTGDIYYFSRQQKMFVDVNEGNIEMLLEEVLKYYT